MFQGLNFKTLISSTEVMQIPWRIKYMENIFLRCNVARQLLSLMTCRASTFKTAKPSKHFGEIYLFRYFYIRLEFWKCLYVPILFLHIMDIILHCCLFCPLIHSHEKNI